jgi:dihydroorotate dehydrogenase
MYGLARSLLFKLDAETAHNLALSSFDKLGACGLAGLAGATLGAPGVTAAKSLPVNVMGIDFPNPVGLAAGLDKNGDHIDALAALGFGFIEIGTITPRPQPGNPKPRMFRLVKDEALINRLGFNNLGLEALIANVERSSFVKNGGVLGINIGKNFDTPNERAADDYLTCLKAVWQHARYITVNISSPNTKNLRELQDADALQALLSALRSEADSLAKKHDKRVPIALKIAPDLTREQVEQIVEIVVGNRFDALITTNTTISREGLQEVELAKEAGGLSGKPLQSKSDQVLTWASDALGGRLPLIGVGGIMSGADAQRKFERGASLVQMYTGFIYQGPGLIADILRVREQSLKGI